MKASQADFVLREFDESGSVLSIQRSVDGTSRSETGTLPRRAVQVERSRYRIA
jgi:hypothetical protein